MNQNNNLTREELLKLHRRRRKNIVINIILIIVLLIISIYVIYNIELVKSTNQDWCKLCMKKTGVSCFIQGKPINQEIEGFEINLSNINLQP